jgi:signal transduction histidine kinase
VWATKPDDSRVPVNVSCTPLYNEENELVGAVEVFTDMTKEAEIDRIKRELCTIVAHELRTPLTSISGYLETIMDEIAGSITDEQRIFLAIVQSNVAG